MNRILFTCFLPLFLLFSTPAARAQPPEQAEALVKDVTGEVLKVLRDDPGLQSGDRQKAISVIETKVAPNFDFARMTSLAVGPAWKKADIDQQQALVREFRTLLVRTYANALTAYRNQSVSFRPARPGEANEVRIPCRINQPGGRPIDMVYSLIYSGEEWKVYDVVIENISLVTNYRSSFAAEVERGGIEGLIKTLQSRNRGPQQGKSAPVAMS